MAVAEQRSTKPLRKSTIRAAYARATQRDVLGTWIPVAEVPGLEVRAWQLWARPGQNVKFSWKFCYDFRWNGECHGMGPHRASAAELTYWFLKRIEQTA